MAAIVDFSLLQFGLCSPQTNCQSEFQKYCTRLLVCPLGHNGLFVFELLEIGISFSKTSTPCKVLFFLQFNHSIKPESIYYSFTYLAHGKTLITWTFIYSCIELQTRLESMWLSLALMFARCHFFSQFSSHNCTLAFCVTWAREPIFDTVTCLVTFGYNIYFV